MCTEGGPKGPQDENTKVAEYTKTDFDILCINRDLCITLYILTSLSKQFLYTVAGYNDQTASVLFDPQGYMCESICKMEHASHRKEYCHIIHPDEYK
jgi:hypothetical protein